MKQKICIPTPDNVNEFVNNLTSFYARLDCQVFFHERNVIIENLECDSDDKLTISEIMC